MGKLNLVVVEEIWLIFGQKSKNLYPPNKKGHKTGLKTPNLGLQDQKFNLKRCHEGLFLSKTLIPGGGRGDWAALQPPTNHQSQ